MLFKRLDNERRLLSCLPNTSTFVPNDCSQSLHCGLPIMRCAFGAHLDGGLAERRTPCRFVGNLVYPSLFLGEDDRLVFDKTEPLNMLSLRALVSSAYSRFWRSYSISNHAHISQVRHPHPSCSVYHEPVTNSVLVDLPQLRRGKCIRWIVVFMFCLAHALFYLIYLYVTSKSFGWWAGVKLTTCGSCYVTRCHYPPFRLALVLCTVEWRLLSKRQNKVNLQFDCGVWLWSWNHAHVPSFNWRNSNNFGHTFPTLLPNSDFSKSWLIDNWFNDL